MQNGKPRSLKHHSPKTVLNRSSSSCEFQWNRKDWPLLEFSAFWCLLQNVTTECADSTTLSTLPSRIFFFFILQDLICQPTSLSCLGCVATLCSKAELRNLTEGQNTSIGINSHLSSSTGLNILNFLLQLNFTYLMWCIFPLSIENWLECEKWALQTKIASHTELLKLCLRSCCLTSSNNPCDL